jgi:hypothetical protein
MQQRLPLDCKGGASLLTATYGHLCEIALHPNPVRVKGREPTDYHD